MILIAFLTNVGWYPLFSPFLPFIYLHWTIESELRPQAKVIFPAYLHCLLISCNAFGVCGVTLA